MNLLLDTHTWLWFALGDSRLSSTAKSLILDPANVKSVSPASYWELAIKVGLGKYKLHAPFDQFVEGAVRANGFQVVPIEIKHAHALIGLPYHHRDPFDRMLIAQAIVDQLELVSNDPTLDSCPIRRVW